MKQAFRSLCAIVVLTFACGALSAVWAQTPSATPEPFVIQLTSSPSALFSSFTGDISGNGRFVVFESNGDVATEKTAARNNADGNREIFVADYGQRRIFQITNTRNVPKAAASPTPTPTPTPTPSPTPSPVPTPSDPAQVQIEISNNRPMISFAPSLNGNGNRVYTIVFSSNATDPGSFDGVDSGNALAADGNQEVWIYQLPEVADVDLSSGADLPLLDLASGSFTRITNTPASRVPSPGATGVPPFVADDNRQASISDNGNIIAFVSTRNLVSAVGNTDGNPEIFFFNRTTSTVTQVTNSQDVFDSGRLIYSVFNENPSLSADGTVFAFISNADLAANNNDDGNNRGNAEVYVANFNGATVSGLRQATRTKGESTGATVNLLSYGRRLSRDGSMLAFESRADDPKANATTNQSFLAIFVYNLAADTFVRVGTRATGFPGDIIHFPTFTDYNNSLMPNTLVFASALNFKTDGTFPATDQGSTGLNPNNLSQVFATQIPATSSNTFTRLTRTPQIQAGGSFGGIRPLASETRKRIAFSLAGTDLGGGNEDNSNEVFYLLSPVVTTEPAAALSVFTGASNIPLPAPSPSPSPSVGTVTGLAPGELGILRSTVAFVSSDRTATGASETARSPALPVELNGVAVSVNGAAAGLYFVGQTSRQINFVVPIGVALGTAPVVVNSIINGGTELRGSVLIVAAQPDIFTTSNDAGGRAAVVNVTNPMARTGEPFSVTSPDKDGNVVPTVLEISLTGVRDAINSEIKVTVGTTEITGEAILFVGPNLGMPGWDLINFKLPASLASAGDVPIIVTFTRSGTAFSSRPADTAPRITIGP